MTTITAASSCNYVSTPIRFWPTSKTLCRFFVASGKKSAKSDCCTILVNENSTFFGAVYHIRIARNGGLRCGRQQRRKDHRAMANFVLLCATCEALRDPLIGEFTKGIRHLSVVDGHTHNEDPVFRVTDVRADLPWLSFADVLETAYGKALTHLSHDPLQSSRTGPRPCRYVWVRLSSRQSEDHLDGYHANIRKERCHRRLRVSEALSRVSQPFLRSSMLSRRVTHG